MFIQLLLHLAAAHAQTYDLYEAQNAKAPILIFAHGGAWRTGNKSEYRDWGTEMAKLGICVAVLDYRMSSEAKHPAPINDLQRVIGKIKSAQCNAERLYLSGHSAGAHMVAYWNTEYKDKRVRGFVGLEGIYDLPKLIEVYPKYRNWFLTDEFGLNFEAASPTRRSVKEKAPWLVIHSQKDELINSSHSKIWIDALRKQNVEVESLIVNDGTHFGVVENLASNEAGRAILKFMGVPAPTPSAKGR